MLAHARRVLVIVLGVCLWAVSLPTRALAQQAALLGTVLEDSTERPIVNAEIAIPALQRLVRSDSAGNFSLSGIPSGVYRVTVRAVGRAPLQETIAFGTAGRIERDYLLARATTTLEQVDVRADATVEDVRLAEFHARRRFGTGRFVTQEVLAQADGRALADVLASRIPGLRSESMGGNQRAMVSARGVISFRSQRCYVKVMVDRILRYNGTPDPLFDINTLDPATLVGVEYYTTAQVPAEFNGTGSPCGTLVIWTRMR